MAEGNPIQIYVITTAEINHLVLTCLYESCRCGRRQLQTEVGDDDSGDKPSRVHLLVRVLLFWL